VTLRDPSTGTKEDGSIERSKIAIGRTPGPKNTVGAPWWRITVYAGDAREEIDGAMEEALRVDAELAKRLR
jgi:hypothetical protein